MFLEFYRQMRGPSELKSRCLLVSLIITKNQLSYKIKLRSRSNFPYRYMMSVRELTELRQTDGPNKFYTRWLFVQIMFIKRFSFNRLESQQRNSRCLHIGSYRLTDLANLKVATLLQNLFLHFPSKDQSCKHLP